MEWKEIAPRYGDIVRTKVSFYYHYGIFADETRVIQFGLPDGPMRPSSEIRVLVSDIDTFLNGGELEVGVPSRDEKKTMRDPREIVAAAEAKLGTGGYDILHNNCEHFVNECAFGDSRSDFVSSVRAALRKKLGKE